MNGSGSHHTWGALGYWLSARIRFFNTIGCTMVAHNPDSWEGWYWGAMHHWGYSARNGGGETYGTVEDCLKNAEMIVFWSSDPEATSGVYGAHEGTIRRQWLKNSASPVSTSILTTITRQHGLGESGWRRGRAPIAPWCWRSRTYG